MAPTSAGPWPSGWINRWSNPFNRSCITGIPSPTCCNFPWSNTHLYVVCRPSYCRLHYHSNWTRDWTEWRPQGKGWLRAVSLSRNLKVVYENKPIWLDLGTKYAGHECSHSPGIRISRLYFEHLINSFHNLLQSYVNVPNDKKQYQQRRQSTITG